MKVFFIEVILLFIKMVLYLIKMVLYVIEMVLYLIKMASLAIKMVSYVMDTNLKGLASIFLLGIHMNNVGLYSFFILVQQMKPNGFVFDYQLFFQFILVILISLIAIFILLFTIFLLTFNHFLLNLVRIEFNEQKLQIIAKNLQISNLLNVIIIFDLFVQFIF